MPRRHVRWPTGMPAVLRDGFARLVAIEHVPTVFDDAVVAEAQAAATPAAGALDLTDLAFRTLDPPGSRDLDQAFHFERAGSGCTVWYAIADVASWVVPGHLVDAEARRRGQTMYGPTERYPLYPPCLSEDTASLLADGVARPAAVWRIGLDADGAPTATTVTRALVRSRAQLDYPTCQAAIDAGTADDELLLLREIGLAREAQERARGGISLNLPDQEVCVDGGRWALTYRHTQRIEDWNAQISLLTGQAAAAMMLAGGVGILRTLPAAEPEALDRLHRVAGALGLGWPDTMSYPDFIRSLQPTTPAALAMLTACTSLFRGASYLAFTTAPTTPTVHGALATNYAHVTAPLRRLVDRFATEICLALSAGTRPPDWVTTALPDVPAIMRDADQRAAGFERGVVGLVEALVLSSRRGEVLTGTVVAVNGPQGRVQIADPAVEVEVTGAVALGESVSVRVGACDLVTGRVEAALA